MNLDIKTLILINSIINILNAFIMTLIWRQYRKNFDGLIFFLADMILQAAGFLLIIFRGALPDILTIVLSNTFLIAGALLFLIGLEHFFNMKRKNIHNYILIVLFSCVLAYFSLFRSSLAIREIVISVMIILISIQSCWLLFYRVDPGFRHITKATAFVFLTYILVSLVRIVLLAVFPHSSNSFFNSGMIGSISMTLYLILSIMITISIILLVNTRLLMEVQTQKEKYSITFDSSPYAVILTRMSDGKIFEVNEGFVRITEYQKSDVIGESSLGMKLWVNEEDRVALVNKLSQGNDVRETEMQFRKKSGAIMTGLLSSTMIMINNEKAIITTVSDITEISQLRHELQNLALHDSLTGLPNRNLYCDRFEIATASARRNNKKLAIISMDLDLFKSINDEYGHDAGDQVLVAVSSRLTHLLRKVDTAARFGGDEFVLLIWDIGSRADIVKVIDTIFEGLSAPIDLGGRLVKVTASFGIALYPDDGKDINVLIKNSDVSMYYVKENNRNNYKFFNEMPSGVNTGKLV